MSLWSLDNPVFTDYAFYASVLAAKVLIMGPLTGYYRMTRKAVSNPEDAVAMGIKETKTDAAVERIRRAHQNDLENIPIFWIIGLFFVLTNPTHSTARLAFRAFTWSRITHTVLYLNGSSLRPPSFLVGVVTNAFMIYRVISTFY